MRFDVFFNRIILLLLFILCEVCFKVVVVLDIFVGGIDIGLFLIEVIFMNDSLNCLFDLKGCR